MTEPALLLAFIAVAGIGCQWLAWRLKLPAILPLLVTGLILGPGSGLLDPDRLLGELLFPLVSLGVAVVLFEGSLNLKRRQIEGHGRVVRNLVGIGALINGLVTAAAAAWLMELPLALALLFGALMTVTGPTVVVPLLRTVRPTPAVANILRWEGILIDPLGALLAVLVFQAVLSGQHGNALWSFLSLTAAGTLLGLLGASLTGWLLYRHLLPDYLVNVTVLSLVLGVFALSNTLEHESGLLAVTVMGLRLANRDDLQLGEVVSFKESLSVLIISTLFILLAARMEAAWLAELGWGAAGVLAVMILVARPLAVALATRGSSLNWRERLLIAFIAPRGIVAAAVSALFALRLEQAGMAQAATLVSLTFLVIVVTVVLQSIAARPLAQLLRVAEPEPRGVLIVGSNRVARAVAEALAGNGLPVLMAGTHWDELAQARMKGIATYFGNPVSDHADRNLDLVGIGRLLAMSRRPALNTLACLRYRGEFGKGSVYTLLNSAEQGVADKKAPGGELATPRLFGAELTQARLAALLGEGWRVRTTPLSESFEFADYVRRYRHRALLLFAIDRQERLHIFTATAGPAPRPGWKLIALIPPEPKEGGQEVTGSAPPSQ